MLRSDYAAPVRSHDDQTRHEVGRALVVGAGYVGTALSRLLAASGVEVWTLRRGAEAATDPLIHPVVADVTEGASLRRQLTFLIESPFTVFYLVGAERYDADAYQRAYVLGLNNVIAACADLPLTRLLFASSTAVYGQRAGEWVTEDSPTAPRGFSGRSLLQAEALLQDATVPSCAVRFGGIYGPGRTRLIDRLREGTAIARDGQPWRNRIHRDDCASAMMHLAKLHVPHAVCIAVDDEPTEQRQVQRWLCAQLGQDEAKLQPIANGEGRGGNKRCSNARLKATGYRFTYPTFREGYGKLIAPGGG